MSGDKNSKEKGDPLDVNQRFKKKIGEQLIALRKAKGHSAADKFAFENDIDRAQYGRYERGETDMGITTLRKLITALGSSFKEFFAEGYEEFFVQQKES